MAAPRPLAVRLIPGALSLAVFALLLTRAKAAFAGRAYAAYNGIYIAASILWLWLTEGVQPTRSALIGAGVCFVGIGIILFGPGFLGRSRGPCGSWPHRSSTFGIASVSRHAKATVAVQHASDSVPATRAEAGIRASAASAAT